MALFDKFEEEDCKFMWAVYLCMVTVPPVQLCYISFSMQYCILLYVLIPCWWLSDNIRIYFITPERTFMCFLPKGCVRKKRKLFENQAVLAYCLVPVMHSAFLQLYFIMCKENVFLYLNLMVFALVRAVWGSLITSGCILFSHHKNRISIGRSLPVIDVMH